MGSKLHPPIERGLLSCGSVLEQLVNWFSSPLRFQEAQPGPDRLMTLHCGEHFRLITALTVAILLTWLSFTFELICICYEENCH